MQPTKIVISFVGGDGEVTGTKEISIPAFVPPAPIPRLPKLQTPDFAISEFFDAMKDGRLERQQRAFRLLTRHKAWEAAMKRMLSFIDDDMHPEMKQMFLSLWIGFGLSRPIRKFVGNDDLLVALMQRCIEPYQGPPLELIYRAEDAQNVTRNLVGFEWTPREEWARMHLHHRRSGILLMARPAPDAILAKVPTSIGEDGYLVDVKRLKFEKIY
jgi:hypothetical protein